MSQESENNATIIRAPRDKENPYFLHSRATAQDSTLTFEARGVLSYLLSKPGDWKIQIPDLMREGSIGRDSVYAIIKELREHKYLILEQDRDQGRFGDTRYLLYETPLTEKPEAVGEKHISPLPALPDTVKPQLQNTESSLYNGESDLGFGKQSTDSQDSSNDESLNIVVEHPSSRRNGKSPMPPKSEKNPKDKFEVGQTVYVWSDERRKQIPCTVVKVTEKQVRVLSSEEKAFKNSNHEYVEKFSKGKSNVKHEPSNYDTLDDYSPEVQEILRHAWNVQDGEGIPGPTASKANTVWSLIKDRYAPVEQLPDAEELDMVFSWAKEEDGYFARGKYKDPEKIADFVRMYRQNLDVPGGFPSDDDEAAFYAADRLANPQDYMPDEDIEPIPYDPNEVVICPVGRVWATGSPRFWTRQQLIGMGYDHTPEEQAYMQDVLDDQQRILASETFQTFLAKTRVKAAEGDERAIEYVRTFEEWEAATGETK